MLQASQGREAGSTAFLLRVVALFWHTLEDQLGVSTILCLGTTAAKRIKGSGDAYILEITDKVGTGDTNL
jgi:hypothetical protein